MVEASGVWEVSEPLLLEAAVKFYRPKGIVAKVVNHFAAATVELFSEKSAGKVNTP